MSDQKWIKQTKLKITRTFVYIQQNLSITIDSLYLSVNNLGLCINIKRVPVKWRKIRKRSPNIAHCVATRKIIDQGHGDFPRDYNRLFLFQQQFPECIKTLFGLTEYVRCVFNVYFFSVNVVDTLPKKVSSFLDDIRQDVRCNCVSGADANFVT